MSPWMSWSWAATMKVKQSVYSKHSSPSPPPPMLLLVQPPPPPHAYLLQWIQWDIHGKGVKGRGTGQPNQMCRHNFNHIPRLLLLTHWQTFACGIGLLRKAVKPKYIWPTWKQQLGACQCSNDLYIYIYV